MRIAIDTRWIFENPSGIGVYTREIVCGLAEVDRRNDYLLLFHDAAIRDRTFEDPRLGRAPNFRPVLVPYGPFSILNQVALPAWLARQRIEVFHTTNYMIPLAAFPRYRAGHAKCVATIHDVIPLILPGHAPRSRKSRLQPVYRWLMVEIGKRADCILTVSHASAADIVKHLRIPKASAGKVRAIYNGVSEHFHEAAQPVPGGERADPSAPYRVLYVGRSDPYKNLPLLVRAVAELRKQSERPVELVIAGSPDPRYPQASKLAAELDLTRAVHWTGQLDDGQLQQVYRSCDVLAHPSRYEGFGLQIIEAMASGLPVVCTTGGSLREVAGDAAVLVPPDDLDELVRGMRTVMQNPDRAAELVQLGLQRAAGFRWSRTVAETLAVYHEVTKPRARLKLF